MIDPDTGEVVCPFLRTGYNYDMNAASVASGLDCSNSPSLTHQSFKEECDINTIVERFGLTGQLPTQPVVMPLSGDFTDAVNDYHTAANMVIAADAAFMELPAATRARFHNNPQELLEFIENKDNLEEARKIGIAVDAPKAPDPIAVRVMGEVSERKTS